MGARDLRTLWSHVLQHHHHHLRQAFASRFGFLSNANETKLETKLLVWKHKRVATEKKWSWSWSAPIKISLLFSPLSSSSSSLACSSAVLLLQATLPPCWEPENGRARSTRARDQRAGRPSVTNPARHPPRRAPVSGNPEVWECWARPGRPSVTDPSSVTDKQEKLFFQKLHNFHEILLCFINTSDICKLRLGFAKS